ncbi:MAG: signal peptidase I [Kiritimatiellae bacterium]|nr:signal peptidase I [Kiritimatiellia bacterium]
MKKAVALWLLFVVLHVALFLSPLPLFAGVGLLLAVRVLIGAEAAVQSRRRAGAVLRPYQRWHLYAVYLVLGTLAARGLRAGLMPEIEVAGESMRPTLLPGDVALGNRLVYWFRRPRAGDVVVLANPLAEGRFLVKRVVAAGGESVTVDGAGVTVSRGDEAARTGTGGPGKTWQVPAGHVFVLGDNRSRRPDSRDFGPVAERAVRVKLARIFRSWDFETERMRWDRPGKEIR